IEISLEKLNITAKQGTLAVSLSYNNAEIIQASAEISVVQQNATETPAENITNITESPVDIIEINITAPENITNATLPEINITTPENITEINITNATAHEINVTIPENITELNITGQNITNATLQNVTELNITEMNITQLNLSLIRGIPGITLEKNSNTTLNLSEYFAGTEGYKAVQPENISISISGQNALVMPEVNFIGTRNASITAYRENESIKEDFVINIQETNITIQTIQYNAVIGKPVRWEKRIKPEKPENITITLPASSKNITLRKITQENETPIEITGITGKAISGGVVAELNPEKEPKFITFLKKLFRLGKVTGRVIEAEETEHAGQIEVNITAEDNAEYEIEYYTEAPYAIEENVSGYKKRIVVSGPELNYTNILAFTAISEIIPLGRENAIRLYWLQNGSIEVMPFNAYDTNNNSFIDYVEWVVPHLSNQTFEIVIEISKAEHLDKDRAFISDIYNETYQLDGIWSEEISNQDYVRVAFKENLTSKNDITIYPRIVNGNPRIEVYEVNGSGIIAEFASLVSNAYNQVLLTNLASSQDTFDLRVIGGSIELDHIIDPSESQNVSINETADYFLLWNQYNLYKVMKTGIQVNNPPNNWSQIKWCLQGTASGNSITKCVDGLSNWNWTYQTDNNTYAWLYGTNRITTALGNVVIGVNYSLEDISTMIKIEIGAYNGLSTGISNLNFSYEHHNITIMNDWQNDWVGGYVNGDWAEVELNKTLDVNVVNISDNTFWIFDKVKGGNIKFNWTAGNAYVWLKSNNEINTPVRLIVPAGNLAAGQIKKTTFHWVDARSLSTVTLNAPTSPLALNETQNFTMTCSWTQTGTGQGESGTIWWVFDNSTTKNVTINEVTQLNTTDTNPQTGTSAGTQYSITVEGAVAGIYQVRCNVYGNNLGANRSSGNMTINVSVPPDNTNPQINITKPLNNTNWSVTLVNVNYTVSDANLQACWYSNNSGAVNRSIQCGQNITNQSFMEGYNNITIWANDSSNNQNQSSVRFLVDTKPPSVIIAYPTNNSNFS
ncbi:hypothetical protein HYT26_02485, partial [Candidatus Pacearchaeota archaeon]|nr:hypothetical protein [Candidatus Pacearchaeota archaeon]